MIRVLSRLRLTTGLFLAVFLTQHLLNHSLGIISIEAAETGRQWLHYLFQTTPVLILFYLSVVIHVGIALFSIYRRSSLRLSLWQWLQILLGLSIIPLVAGHVIGNRGAALLGEMDPNYYYVLASMHLSSFTLIKLVILIPLIWGHMAIGLHFWLRIKPGYPRYLPWLYAFVILIPTLAYAGLISMLREASQWMDDVDRLDQIFAALNAMPRSDLSFLLSLEVWVWIGAGLLLLAVLAARQIRLWVQARRGTYLITTTGGREVRALQGLSLLEALRNARIPHASVCGGRARCTTCRVRVGCGLEHLAPPNDLEAAALTRIQAGADVRLACQIHPTANLTITPLVEASQPLAAALHSGGVQGHEEYVVAMFVDMRGSTSLGERVLAYDVVFILNRFFTELSDSLRDTHGHYAQFAGDGLMALYGLEPERKHRACADALDGARAMFDRIEALNQQLAREFGESVKMGIGIHGGEAIVGTMGPPKTPLLTAVGDNINIAARLEAQTKQQDCDLIVSVETLERENLAVEASSVRELDVRGRDNAVRVCLFDRADIPSANPP